MTTSLLILCLATLSAPQAPPAQVLQELPLGGLVAPFDGVLRAPPPFAREFGEGRDLIWSSDGLSSIHGEDLIGLLRDEIGDEQLAQSSLDYNQARGSIFVRAPEELTRKAAVQLAWLERIAARPLQIAVTVYAVDGEPQAPRGTYGPGEVKQIAGLRPLWTSSSAATLHRPVGFENLGRRAVVLDFDVEVAQKADIADPKVKELLTGLRASVLPFALAGNDEIGLVVDLAYAVRIDDGEQLSTGLERQGTVDAPRLRSFVASFSGRVSDKGSLVAWSLGDEKGGLRGAIEISASWRAPAAPAREDLAVLGVAFACAGLEPREEIDANEGAAPGEAYAIGAGSQLRSRRARLQFDELRVMVQDAVGDLERSRVAIEQLGPWLVARGSPADVTAVRAAVARLVDETAAVADVVLETRIEGGNAFHHLIAPSLAGMPVHLRRGEEGWRIRDFEVEIAQSAAVANAVVQPWFAGASAAVVTTRRLSGLGAVAAIELVVRGPAQRRGLETDYGGAFDATLFDAARLSLDAAVDRGTTIPLGYGPSLASEAGSVRTLQFVTIR